MNDHDSNSDIINVLILFLSNLTYNIDTLEPNLNPLEYYENNLGDMDIKGGSLSNVAPTEYIISALKKENTSLTNVIAITTSQSNHELAPESYKFKKSKDAWHYFQEQINEFAENRQNSIEYDCVPYYEDKVSDDFIYNVIDKIKALKTDGAQVRIHLEITGGFRDSVMNLLAMSRMLRTHKIYVGHVVFASFNPKKIVERTQLYNMFDLIAGAEEFINYGSVKTLKYFFQDSEDEKVRKALSAMEIFSTNLNLCREVSFDNDVINLKRHIGNNVVFSDKLFSQILEPIRENYSGIIGEGSSLLTQLEWCLKTDRIQQAYTLYDSLIPAFLDKKELFNNLNKQLYPLDRSGRCMGCIKKECAIKEMSNQSIKHNLDNKVAVEILDNYYEIKRIRNTMNHAGKIKTSSNSSQTLPEYLKCVLQMKVNHINNIMQNKTKERLQCL